MGKKVIKELILDATKHLVNLKRPQMIRSAIILLFFYNILIPGCTEGNKERHYKYVGQVSFRRSYAGHENWSEAELDSVEKSNPAYLFTSDSSTNKMLAILNRLGVSNNDELFLDKIAPDLKDSIIIVTHNSDIDSVCISYDMTHTKASIQIKNRQSIDSIPIKDESFSHTFNLIRLSVPSNPFILFVSQYYIINGDNYEVSIYEKK